MNNQLNSEACSAILDTAKSIYYEEIDRFKQAETKIGIAIAFTGVIFGAFLTFVNLNSINQTSLGFGLTLYSSLFKLIILALLVSSFYQFFKAMQIDDFQQIDIDSIVDSEFAKYESQARVKFDIAVTYKKAIVQNEEKIANKLNRYNNGLRFVAYAFAMFVTHYVVEGIIKYGT
ncbi:hypothetical protein ACFQZE_11740 [Paenibacillus sp. GCM10027627]|uniref:hypothetical protein n=1 Tax=unclassified Paenibacillus TaxID=185978 RepID=UPI00362D4857